MTNITTTQWICPTCGTQYAPSATPPAFCTICSDDRQYVARSGQRWTTLAAERGRHHTRFEEVEPGIVALRTEPGGVDIGQQAFLISTPHGNVLWETRAFIDEATVAEIERRGGVQAIAISHPHFYTSMGTWSRDLGDVPIHVHADNAPWVMDTTAQVRFFHDETCDLLPGITILRTGGHFPGSSILHVQQPDGTGVILTGDTIQVVPAEGWVSFLYSYPNLIPMAAASVQRIVDALEPFPFERLHNSFGTSLWRDAQDGVRRSAERYIRHISDPAMQSGPQANIPPTTASV